MPIGPLVSYSTWGQGWDRGYGSELKTNPQTAEALSTNEQRQQQGERHVLPTYIVLLVPAKHVQYKQKQSSILHYTSYSAHAHTCTTTHRHACCTCARIHGAHTHTILSFLLFNAVPR